MNYAEQQLQIAVCTYLRWKYKDIMFTSDVGSGANVGKRQGAINKKLRSDNGWPDLFIASPRGGLHGMFIELKRDGIRLKNGELPKTDHIIEQKVMLDRLIMRGYRAKFAVGIDEAMKVIDDYMLLK